MIAVGREMQSERTSVSPRPRRAPRKGIFFVLVRFGGLLLTVLGLLLLGIAVIGFCVVLVRIGPTLVGSIQHLQEQMAGFIFLISLVNLLIFPFVGLLGMAMAGIGLVLSYVGTEPAVSTPAFMPGQKQNSRHHGSVKNGAG